MSAADEDKLSNPDSLQPGTTATASAQSSSRSPLYQVLRPNGIASGPQDDMFSYLGPKEIARLRMAGFSECLPNICKIDENTFKGADIRDPASSFQALAAALNSSEAPRACTKFAINLSRSDTQSHARNVIEIAKEKGSPVMPLGEHSMRGDSFSDGQAVSTAATRLSTGQAFGNRRPNDVLVVLDRFGSNADEGYALGIQFASTAGISLKNAQITFRDGGCSFDDDMLLFCDEAGQLLSDMSAADAPTMALDLTAGVGYSCMPLYMSTKNSDLPEEAVRADPSELSSQALTFILSAETPSPEMDADRWAQVLGYAAATSGGRPIIVATNGWTPPLSDKGQSREALRDLHEEAAKYSYQKSHSNGKTRGRIVFVPNATWLRGEDVSDRGWDGKKLGPGQIYPNYRPLTTEEDPSEGSASRNAEGDAPEDQWEDAQEQPS